MEIPNRRGRESCSYRMSTPSIYTDTSISFIDVKKQQHTALLLFNVRLSFGCNLRLSVAHSKFFHIYITHK